MQVEGLRNEYNRVTSQGKTGSDGSAGSDSQLKQQMQSLQAGPTVFGLDVCVTLPQHCSKCVIWFACILVSHITLHYSLICPHYLSSFYSLFQRAGSFPAQLHADQAMPLQSKLDEATEDRRRAKADAEALKSQSKVSASRIWASSESQCVQFLFAQHQVTPT